MVSKGRALRERYGELIDQDVKQEDVYVLSSSVPRTVESVQCLLRGFFHDNDESQQSYNAPQFYVHTYEHNVLAPMHPQQVFNEIELIVHDDVLNLRSKVEQDATKKLALHLRKCLGIPDDQLLSWTALRPTIRGFGIVFIIAKTFATARLRMEWKEVYSFVKAVVEKKHIAKLSFFSAHDNSIVALLGALQIEVGSQLPKYGTTLALEVYEDKTTGKYFIAPRYENEVVSFAGHTQDPLCPFSHFESLALSFLHPTK
ncbi:unnamed protein product [Peronospora destructor]|uniref:Histidine acid phosphatase n=1 Tax=Peronospora destructor TaxID=86335 RepID=A0AAV0V7A9_9STRA|nr:unnamed protein product [Peronospora destructor]